MKRYLAIAHEPRRAAGLPGRRHHAEPSARLRTGSVGRGGRVPDRGFGDTFLGRGQIYFLVSGLMKK